jgi:hypothetical protein
MTRQVLCPPARFKLWRTRFSDETERGLLPVVRLILTFAGSVHGGLLPILLVSDVWTLEEIKDIPLPTLIPPRKTGTMLFCVSFLV